MSIRKTDQFFQTLIDGSFTHMSVNFVLTAQIEIDGEEVTQYIREMLFNCCNTELPVMIHKRHADFVVR